MSHLITRDDLRLAHGAGGSDFDSTNMAIANFVIDRCIAVVVEHKNEFEDREYRSVSLYDRDRFAARYSAATIIESHLRIMRSMMGRQP